MPRVVLSSPSASVTSTHTLIKPGRRTSTESTDQRCARGQAHVALELQHVGALVEAAQIRQSFNPHPAHKAPRCRRPNHPRSLRPNLAGESGRRFFSVPPKRASKVFSRSIRSTSSMVLDAIGHQHQHKVWAEPSLEPVVRFGSQSNRHPSPGRCSM